MEEKKVTHGAEIIVELSFTEKINEIDIDGGEYNKMRKEIV